jgi:hypothetical protein
MNTCSKCKKQFEPSQAEKDFLKKVDLPHQGICPDCRRQRRFAFRNERKLYHRKCDLTEKQIISIYRPDSPYKVYDQHEWHSDKWDAFDSGRDFDFSRPFFEQMNELMLDVPKISVFTSKNENSDYTNGAQQDKDCYMIFVSDHNEDCYYSYGIDSCKDSIDCLNCYNSELCIQCIDCSDSYNVAYGQQSHNCSNSTFLYDCKNCRDCFGCYGLRGKENYIFNEPYKKADYEAKIKDINIGNIDNLKEFNDGFEEGVRIRQIHQYYDGNNNVDSTGDHIVNCKNCVECYDSGDLEDCGYLIFSFKSKDCFDGHVVVDNCELCYETVSTINQYNTQFTFVSFYSKNGMYLDHCLNTQDCFACSGLKKAQYCIFNKQYSKEEYEELKAKIIEHMKSTGEWGQPWPIELSPFGYNETVAHEFYPLTKEEVLKNGWKWTEDEDKDSDYQGPITETPNDIKDVDKDITEKILICEKTKKPFKIIPKELRLYKMHNLPLPRMIFDERHLERISKRNPRNVWERKCEKCGTAVTTSYSEDRPETIYCEKCYQEAVV